MCRVIYNYFFNVFIIVLNYWMSSKFREITIILYLIRGFQSVVVLGLAETFQILFPMFCSVCLPVKIIKAFLPSSNSK